jgi:AraC-like DNA-binding protein
VALDPIPVGGADNLREVTAGDFNFSEARHLPGLKLGRHVHEHATITILLKGAFRETYANGHTEEVNSASVLIRPAGEAHADHMGAPGAHNLVVEIEPARLEAIAERTHLLESVAQLADPRLLQIGRRIQSELALGNDTSPLALEGLALELVTVAARMAEPRHASPPAWLCRVHNLLRDGIAGEELPISKLAEIAGVHPVSLARAFRAHYGTTPGEYRRQIRLEWAAQALVRTTRSLGDIALAAGFADQSHFTRVFRRTYGVTPSRFRSR